MGKDRMLNLETPTIQWVGMQQDFQFTLHSYLSVQYFNTLKIPDKTVIQIGTNKLKQGQ
ncbi:hypothetical protein SESBI_49721, partial [Sesbania bispinosa]